MSVRLWRTISVTSVSRSPPCLQCLADRQIAHGGDDNTVNVGSIDLPGEDDAGLASTIKFAQSHGSSFRHISDMGAPDSSAIVNFMGEDGVILSPQYDAELSQWAFGGYNRMCMSADCAFAPSMVKQTLSP